MDPRSNAPETAAQTLPIGAGPRPGCEAASPPTFRRVARG